MLDESIHLRFVSLQHELATLPLQQCILFGKQLLHALALGSQVQLPRRQLRFIHAVLAVCGCTQVLQCVQLLLDVLQPRRVLAHQRRVLGRAP